MENKEFAEGLYEWAEKDGNNRVVLCITSEKTGENEEGFNLNSSITLNGKKGLMIAALVDAMEDDNDFVDVIRDAFLAYTIKHTKPAGIGVITISNGKEANDE